MKKHFIACLIFSVVMTPVFSQQTTTRIIKVPVMHPVIKTTVKLNGQLNGAFGGTTRSTIPVFLPLNTVEWHYSFTTRKSGDISQELTLGLQIAGILTSVTTAGVGGVVFSGLTKVAAHAISTPSGSVPVNAYSLNGANATNFINGNRFNYYHGYSMTNVTQGTIQVPYIGLSSLYLGFENLNNWKGILIDVEVVAIVMEDKIITETIQSNSNNENAGTYNRNSFIGMWKDENSTFTLSADGSLYMHWDTGKSGHGNWNIIKNQLNLDFSKNETNGYRGNDYYNILNWDGKYFRYQQIANGINGFIYNAVKQ